MDLGTFITTVYVEIDDWYKEQVREMKPRRGRPPIMSDSEVLTLAVVGQWRVGVPWQSERGLIRFAHQHLKSMFPTLLERSAFNYRVRQLYGVLVRLQQYLAQKLRRRTDLYECVDCIDLPAYTLGHGKRQKTHWFWFSATKGWARGGWFIGHKLLMGVDRSGAVTGWVIGAGHMQDRWLLEGLLSARNGCPQVVEPKRRIKSGQRGHTPPPAGFLGGWTAAGLQTACPYLADKGFNGKRWSTHWRRYNATVISPPVINAKNEPLWTRSERKAFAGHRQIIETVFARLVTVFRLKSHQTHSISGLLARMAAITVAYNTALYINRQLNRAAGELVTLIC
jgi:hypothetical protein